MEFEISRKDLSVICDALNTIIDTTDWNNAGDAEIAYAKDAQHALKSIQALEVALTQASEGKW